MGRTALILLLVWALEVFLVGALVRQSWFVDHLREEDRRATEWLGEKTVTSIRARADVIFEEMFVETGLFDTSYEIFIPSDVERRRTKGMEDMGRPVFEVVQDRLNVAWLAVHQVIIRVLTVALWIPFLLLALTPAIVDGAAMREVKKATLVGVSAGIHRYAMWCGGLVLFTVLLVLFSPIFVNPLFYPFAILVGVVCVALVVGNTQKKI